MFSLPDTKRPRPHRDVGLPGQPWGGGPAPPRASAPSTRRCRACRCTRWGSQGLPKGAGCLGTTALPGTQTHRAAVSEPPVVRKGVMDCRSWVQPTATTLTSRQSSANPRGRADKLRSATTAGVAAPVVERKCNRYGLGQERGTCCPTQQGGVHRKVTAPIHGRMHMHQRGPLEDAHKQTSTILHKWARYR